jgi:hypothetical protein
LPRPDESGLAMTKSKWVRNDNWVWLGMIVRVLLAMKVGEWLGMTKSKLSGNRSREQVLLLKMAARHAIIRGC